MINKKIYVSHSPPEGKIIGGTFKARWGKSIKDTKSIGGNVIAIVYGNSKEEVEELAKHFVELHNSQLK